MSHLLSVMNRKGSTGLPIAALVLMACLLSGFAQAGSVTVMAEARSQDLNGIAAFQASDTDISAAEIQQAPETSWQPAPDEINLGYDDRTFWFRFRLENPEPESLERLLVLSYPLLDVVDVYKANNGTLTNLARTGDSRPFSQRPVNHKYFVIPLKLDALSTTTLYIKVRTAGAVQVPLELWQQEAFYSDSQSSLVLESIFYGVMLIMAVFNLFIYLSLRERAYLYYVFLVASTILFVMSLQGFSFQYLFPESPWLNQAVFVAIVPLSLLFLCLFAREYLGLKEKYPGWNRLFIMFFTASALALVAAATLPYATSTRISITLALPVALLNLIAGLTLWRKKEKSAIPFSVAWILLVVAVLMTIFNKIGWTPSSILTQHGIPLGATLLVIMYSFALADRFNRERNAYFQERQTALDALEHQKQAESALLHASRHNEITGLPNRSLFEQELKNAAFLCNENTTAVFLLHLQRFDDVNKTLGHMHADELLQVFAERMNRIICNHPLGYVLEEGEHEQWAVSHIEGVTLAFILSGASHNKLFREASRITDQLAEPIEFKGLSLELGFIVGSSTLSVDNNDPQTLLRQAFIAFDQGITNGIPIATYRPEMNPYSPQRLTLMTELRAAINKGTLELYFQPQIHLQSRRVSGFEALIRWNHPESGFIPPDEFIPMAEKTGLIKPLTRWVVRQALSFCNELDKRDCDAKVSVNISAVNLREPGFSDEICELLTEQSVAAQRLVLEVTETAAMVDPVMSLGVLRALQRARVRLSIDDFGTGHSSLSYIRKLPVNEIKIDRSFVSEMNRNQSDATIVRTTINMCHDLGYDVVAEGVENAATQELLTQLGCDFIQGYHVARPMDATTALAWLDSSDWDINLRDSEYAG